MVARSASDNRHYPSSPVKFIPFIVSNRTNAFYSLAFSTIIMLLGYSGLLLRRHYSTDSYHLIDNQQAYWYLQNGRYTWWQVTMWLDQHGINLVLDQRPLLVLAIISFTLSLTLLTLVFSYVAGLTMPLQVMSVNMVLSLLFINVFVEEFMLFPEVAVSAAIGFLFVTIAATLLLKSSRWQYAIGSFVCLMLALGCYQSLIGYYLAIVLVGGALKTPTIANGKKVKSVILRWTETIAIAGIAGIANIVIVKMLIKASVIIDPGRGATTNVHTMLANIIIILKYQFKLWWNADGLMAPGSMIILLCIVITGIVMAIRLHVSLNVTELLFAAALSYAASFAVHVLERDIQLTPRSNMAFWAVQGILLATLICSLFTKHNLRQERPVPLDKDNSNGAGSQIITNNNARSMFVFISVISIFVFGVTLNMQDISYDLYTSNSLDKDYALNVAAKIHDYEKETGVSVKKIAIKEDAKPQQKYRSTRYYNNQLGHRIMNVDYANYQMINYLGRLQMEKIDFPSKIYKEYFNQKNWEVEDLDQQLIIKGDTAYLMLY